jgi:hypothetical protein
MKGMARVKKVLADLSVRLREITAKKSTQESRGDKKWMSGSLK